MNLNNFIKNKKNTINLLTKIYLWGFALTMLSLICTIISPNFLETPATDFNLFSIIGFLIELLLSFFLVTFYWGVPIILVIYKKTNNINKKIFEKNKISFTLDKFFRYGIIIMFFLVLPVILIATYFISGKHNLIYYFTIIFSSLTPIVFIHICTNFYNIITNLKQKERWKIFALNIFLYIILMLYFDRLFILLMKTV